MGTAHSYPHPSFGYLRACVDGCPRTPSFGWNHATIPGLNLVHHDVLGILGARHRPSPVNDLSDGANLRPCARDTHRGGLALRCGIECGKAVARRDAVLGDGVEAALGVGFGVV